MTWLMVGATLVVGCADPPAALVPPPYADVHGPQATRVASKEFDQALGLLARHDRANDWAPSACESTAKQFLLAAEMFARGSGGDGEEHVARYDAALAYQRCDMRSEAKQVLTALLAMAPAFHRASAQLAILRYAESHDVDAVIRELDDAISASKFQNVDALVSLATFQMQRRSDAADEQGNDDLARAQLNLQRALAIDDSHMAALNQLAILYLDKAGGRGAELQVASVAAVAAEEHHATLELAALICSQAIRKDASYAPIHNTAGLVSVKLGDLSAAARSFAQARLLDAKFFEAHMNYAAVNLQFRGFKQAQAAYDKALALRPKSYEALLGLSLALRGQAGGVDEDAHLARAAELLEMAKAVDRQRPEAYFNQAILMQEFRSRGLPPEKAKTVLLEAKGLFGEFLARASKAPALSEARMRATERMRDIDEMIAFMP